MPSLPVEILAVLMPFSELFTAPTFRHLQVLFAGTVLTLRERTVAAALRAVGYGQDAHFTTFHRVLNRARWSALQGSRVLLKVLLETLVSEGPIVIGIDATLERRRGALIKAVGLYHDAVRSSRSTCVNSHGLRWLCLMILAPVPWAGRVWALPFLTVLCPSQRFFEKYRAPRGAKKLTDWARQSVLLVRRWWPERPIIIVADSSFCVFELLHVWLGREQTQKHPGQPRPQRAPVTAITRLRLDAGLWELPSPTAPLPPNRRGRPRQKGDRLPSLAQRLEDPQTVWHRVAVREWYGVVAGSPQTSQTLRELDICDGVAIWTHGGQPTVPIRWVLIRDPSGQMRPQALLCTDLRLEPEEILRLFVRRWQVEVTFHEARAHLGVETQRQYSDAAIARSTPLLLALYSLVTLIAHRLYRLYSAAPDSQAPSSGHLCWIRSTAWYMKPSPTFTDALAWVRRYLWISLWAESPQIAPSTARPSLLWPPAGDKDQSNKVLSPATADSLQIPPHILHCMAELLAYAT